MLSGVQPVAERKRPLAPVAALATLVPTLLIVVISLPVRLNGDVAYALGGLRTAAKSGFDVYDTFAARPLAYRLVIDGLDRVRSIFVSDTHSLASEVVIRVTTYVVLVAICWLLWAGLRTRLDRVLASTITLLVLTALVLAPPWHFLEPDWLAVPTAVLAVAAALAIPNRVLAAIIAALAITLTVAIKIATFPFAIAAIILIAMVSRRRAIWAAVAGTITTVAWLVLFRFVTTWEWKWFQDQSALLPDAPAKHPFHLGFLLDLYRALRDVALISPICLLAIPALVILLVRSKSTAHRWRTLVLAVVLFGMAIAPGYAQGEWFMYHFASVPVLCALPVAAAFALSPRTRMPLAVYGIFLSIALIWAQHRSPEWRHAHVGDVFYVLLAITILFTIWQAMWARRAFDPADSERGSGERRLVPVSAGAHVAGAIALAAVFAPPVLDGAPYAFSGYDYTVTATNSWQQVDAVAAARKRIGPDTPVLYFTYGSIEYQLGNPSVCRYPSPQWLQRGAVLPRSVGTPSYDDNLKCLTPDTKAKYLIVQLNWFPVKRAPADVRAYVADNFDCSTAKRIVVRHNVIACPRR